MKMPCMYCSKIGEIEVKEGNEKIAELTGYCCKECDEKYYGQLRKNYHKWNKFTSLDDLIAIKDKYACFVVSDGKYFDLGYVYVGGEIGHVRFFTIADPCENDKLREREIKYWMPIPRVNDEVL